MTSKSTDKIPTPAEILRKAADVIDERGWFKGLSEDPDGTGVCSMGALCVAVGLPADANSWGVDGSNSSSLYAANVAANRLERWLDLDLPITQWNDAVAETAEQVTTAMRECATELAGTTP